MRRIEHTYRCRLDGHTVSGIRAEVEQELGKHLVEVHNITDGLRMGLSIERTA